jgi:RNA polymerase sigma-B factor
MALLASTSRCSTPPAPGAPPTERPASSSAAADLLARQSARDRSRESENRLFALHARSPSPATREAIVVRYLALARHVARRYAGGQEPWDDLLQVASVALLKAIDRYHPEHDASFSSFAVPTISGELKRHFRDRCWTVRPPRALTELAPRAVRMRDSLAAGIGRLPTAGEVAEALGIDEDTVSRALRAHAVTSLESLSGPADDEAAASWTSVHDEGYARAEERATLQPLLRRLPRCEREIVALRFIEDRTHVEIAEATGVSHTQVWRVLRSAVWRMSILAQTT